MKVKRNVPLRVAAILAALVIAAAMCASWVVNINNPVAIPFVAIGVAFLMILGGIALAFYAYVHWGDMGGSGPLWW